MATSDTLQVHLPRDSGDGSAFLYVLKAMLGPFGLDVLPVEAETEGPWAELRWPGSAGQGVRLELLRLQQAFDAISGNREKDMPRDKFGRVSAAALGADCSKPLWSEWADQIVMELSRQRPQWKAPERRFTVYLTHDVDLVNPWEPMALTGRLLRPIRRIVHSRLPRGGSWSWLAKAFSFWRTYEDVMAIERRYGALATYFIMSGRYDCFRSCGTRGSWPRRGLRRIVSLAKQYGHRVGIHGGAYSLEDADYQAQRQDIGLLTGSEVTWHRNHYLVWDARRSPSMLAGAGFEVDATVGFHDRNGFRAGLAWPYPLWDHGDQSPCSLREIPLIFMDTIHMDKAADSMWEELYGLLGQARNCCGEVSILFHVEFFVENRRLLSRYEELLRWLVANQAVLSAG